MEEVRMGKIKSDSALLKYVQRQIEWSSVSRRKQLYNNKSYIIQSPSERVMFTLKLK